MESFCKDLKWSENASSAELGTCVFLALLLNKNCILTFSINYFLQEAGCFSSPCPKEGYFQSWALVLLYWKQPFKLKIPHVPSSGLQIWQQIVFVSISCTFCTWPGQPFSWWGPAAWGSGRRRRLSSSSPRTARSSSWRPSRGGDGPFPWRGWTGSLCTRWTWWPGCSPSPAAPGDFVHRIFSKPDEKSSPRCFGYAGKFLLFLFLYYFT